MKASIYQQNIFNHIRTSDKSLMIEAVAGSGKTTTIIALSKLFKNESSVLFCAFNKSITTELRSRLPNNVSCQTLNAIGFRAWCDHIGPGVDVDPSKIYNILQSKPVQEKFKIQWNEEMGKVIPKLVGLAKIHEILPYKECWLYLIDSFDVMIPLNKSDFDDYNSYKKAMDVKRRRCVEIANYVLELSNKSKNVIDFDDQLYLPIINGVKFMKYNTVLVDEYQDINEIQSKIIQSSLAENGRFIGVGDREQSIYGFRGANNNAISHGIKTFNAESLPLNYSYRCPISVIGQASAYSDKILAAPNAQDGVVSQLGEYDAEMFMPDDMVLCRNTAPLIKLAFAIIKSNKPVYIVGSSIGKSIIQRIKSFKCKKVSSLTTNLTNWKSNEIKRRKDIDPKCDLSFIESQYDSIMTFILNMDGGDEVSVLTDDINRLFLHKSKGAIILSTVHKAKGTEARRVFILDRYLIPSKYATKPYQKQQERNLIYVAITRSSEFLGFINTPKEK